MLTNKQYRVMLHKEINTEKILGNINFDDISLFKNLVKKFMQHHKLIGLEALIPYTDKQICLRACGNGMVHAKGTPLEGVELWESINSILKDEDRVGE